MEINDQEANIGVFLALPVEKVYYPAINRLQTELRIDLEHLPHSIRWTQSHRLHLTLFFLGRHSADEIKHVIHCMKRMKFSTYSGKIVLSCDQIQLFPEKKPTVVALTGKASPALIHLREHIAECLEKVNIVPDFSHETKGFLPHVTLGRLEEATDLKAQPVTIDLIFNKLVLFKSEPTDSARSPYVTHTALYYYPLTDKDIQQ